jgi:hypothetical protein
MGWVFGWDALQDLSDRALDEPAAADMRALLLSTPGVRDVHQLRTRKMGDLALVDAHILVDPLISVSEGHYIAESARARVLTDHRVLDALIHVDPENEDEIGPPVGLPPRERVVAEIDAALAQHGLKAAEVHLHYLSSGLDVEVTLPPVPASAREEDAQRFARVDVDALQRKVGARSLSVQRTVDLAAREAAVAATRRANAD